MQRGARLAMRQGDFRHCGACARFRTNEVQCSVLSTPPSSRRLFSPVRLYGPPEAKGVKDWIKKQEPLRVVPETYLKSTPENTRLVVNLATQRIVMLVGGEMCIDSPISSGKRGAATQAGTFTVLERIKKHESATYGSFVDKIGRTVRSGVSMKLDAAPAGTRYIATTMPFFCRFTETGFGIHGGVLPGYPAAHGSIRVPDDVARYIYEKVRVGTPIEIRAE
jgi:lipoprotein-anchoring transpeptidase ErfK/SrfK